MSKPPPALMPPAMTPIDMATGLPAPSPAMPAPVDQVPSVIAAPVIDRLPPPTVRSNPGAWDKCDQETQRILKLDTFDGARFELQKSFGATFATNHAVIIGSSMHPQGKFYQFGSSLVLNDALLVGRMDNSGVLSAQWHQQYANSKWGHHIQASVQPPNSQEESHVQADFDYKGDDFTGGFKFGSGPLVGLSYFQSVHPRVALGGEGYVHLGRGVSNVSARARYTDNNVTAVATYSTMGMLSTTVMRKVNNRVALAAELEVAPSNMQAIMSVGGDFVLRQCRIQLNVTSTGLMQATMQEIVAQPMSLLLSAVVDHNRDLFRFGAGVQLG